MDIARGALTRYAAELAATEPLKLPDLGGRLPDVEYCRAVVDGYLRAAWVAQHAPGDESAQTAYRAARTRIDDTADILRLAQLAGEDVEAATAGLITLTTPLAFGYAYLWGDGGRDQARFDKVALAAVRTMCGPPMSAGPTEDGHVADLGQMRRGLAAAEGFPEAMGGRLALALFKPLQRALLTVARTT